LTIVMWLVVKSTPYSFSHYYYLYFYGPSSLGMNYQIA
jgi:hypothetical protein